MCNTYLYYNNITKHVFKLTILQNRKKCSKFAILTFWPTLGKVSQEKSYNFVKYAMNLLETFLCENCIMYLK